MKLPKLDFDNAPFMSGVLLGLSIGGVLALFAFLIPITLVVMESIPGSNFVAGVLGFVVALPLTIAAAPWSIWGFFEVDPNLFWLSVAAGHLINGVILGVLIGTIAKIHKMHRSKTKTE